MVNLLFRSRIHLFWGLELGPLSLENSSQSQLSPQGSIGFPAGTSTGQLPSALSNCNSHHAFCQFQVHMLSKLNYSYGQWVNSLCFSEEGITLLCFSWEKIKCQ